MKSFEEIKEELLQRVSYARISEAGRRIWLETRDKSDILKMIAENWLTIFIRTDIADARYLLENFTQEELSKAGIRVVTVSAEEDVRPEDDYVLVAQSRDYRIYIKECRISVKVRNNDL